MFASEQQGFTLVEFVVIISIFAIIAAISLFNFSGFNSNISLSNLTHDIALVIRDAQVSGISGQSTNDPENPIPRGVYFEYNSGFSSDIIIFDDFDEDELYQSNTEEVDTITIQTADTIASIETGTSSANANSCTNGGGVRIFFKRPDPNPIVYCGNGSPVSFARINVVASDGSDTRSIEIYPTGQINIE